ncbi:MAG: helix-turn-helix transcriptional regulator [Sphingomonadales bacterium]|nr:helix-turn-helix transcriptional regulator [Sphingomonadales bacterium]
MADILEQTALLDTLTDKQKEVLALVSEGMTSKEIARKLGISESAVNQRIEVIRLRLGGLSRSQIARIYRRTSTLLMTIPTSNSLTGKSIPLTIDPDVAHQSSPEGANGFARQTAMNLACCNPPLFPDLGLSLIGSWHVLLRWS